MVATRQDARSQVRDLFEVVVMGVTMTSSGGDNLPECSYIFPIVQKQFGKRILFNHVYFPFTPKPIYEKTKV